MLTIEWINEQSEPVSEQLIELLTKCLKTAADSEQVEGEVVVTLVDDQRIRELNRDYRGIDQPTDVLSFAMNDVVDDEPEIFFADEETDDDEPFPNMLGDIIISVPRAQAQAEEYGHSFERELGFLVVHGFLHLIGYDHNTEAEEAEMFGRQEQILQQVGLTR